MLCWAAPPSRWFAMPHVRCSRFAAARTPPRTERNHAMNVSLSPNKESAADVRDERLETASPVVEAAKPSTFQLRRILAPVDFSNSSETALRYASELAAKFDGKI